MIYPSIKKQMLIFLRSGVYNVIILCKKYNDSYYDTKIINSI